MKKISSKEREKLATIITIGIYSIGTAALAAVLATIAITPYAMTCALKRNKLD